MSDYTTLAGKLSTCLITYNYETQDRGNQLNSKLSDKQGEGPQKFKCVGLMGISESSVLGMLPSVKQSLRYRKRIKIASQHAIDLRYVSDLLWSRRLKSATIKEGMHGLYSDVKKSENYMIEPKRFLG